MVGNLISDFVKGKKKYEYPAGVQHGIALHRAIDSFTDSHPATKTAKEVFRPDYRLYSGAFVDVVYDHFLATDAGEFNEKSLLTFTENAYNIIDMYAEYLPPAFAAMFPYMRSQNWLYNYRNRWGTEKSLAGVVRRSAYLTESHTAFKLFEQHYQLLQECYRQLWADLKPYSRVQLDALLDDQ